MGSQGSGRHADWGPRCDNQHKIDLAWLKREGTLRPGLSAALKWSTNGHQTGSLGYAVERDGLRLNYRVRVASETWETVNELIPFAVTQPHLGGSRCWFICPSCGRRCRFVYGGRRFRCRKCLRLTYDSQHESAIARAMSQAHKLRDRLGQQDSLDEPFPPKPKGMHWSTYARLEARDAALRHRWSIGTMEWLKKRGFWSPDC